MQGHAFQNRAGGHHFHAFEGGFAAIKGQHGALRLGKFVGHQQNRAVNAADHGFQLAADVNIPVGAAFTVQTHHEQAGFFLQGQQRIGQIIMALALYHFGNAGLLYPRFGFIQHVVAVLQGQFGAFPVKVCQLVQQVLPATQPDATSQVRFRGVALFIQNVQQHQRCFHVPAGPGGVITHRGGCPGTVDTGHYS